MHCQPRRKKRLISTPRVGPVHVEVIRVRALVLLVGRQERPAELRARVREGALTPAAACLHVREVRAEAPLVERLASRNEAEVCKMSSDVHNCQNSGAFFTSNISIFIEIF